MTEEYELNDLIISALENSECPVFFDESVRQKIKEICFEHMYSKNRDGFRKEIEAIVKKAVLNKMLTE